VRRVRLAFTDAAGPVWVNLDDLMLVDNSRRIEPAPPGAQLLRSGLDYTLRLPSWPEPLRMAQSGDGLWRMSGVGAQVRLAGPGESLPAAGDKLDVLGGRGVGRAELLEHNAMRVRFGCTWFFPARPGLWASISARRIRWEYTIYADGRCVVQGELNNAGGREIQTAVIAPATAAAFYGRAGGRQIELNDFAGEVGRWQYMVAPAGEAGDLLASNYLRPAAVRTTIGDADVRAPGDFDKDGFDESQGCYCLGSRGGQCRFVVDPPPGGLLAPVFLLTGPWPGRVCVSSEGQAIGSVVRRTDGSILVRLPGNYQRATAVEVSADASGASD
jgi:hypothetical protein